MLRSFAIFVTQTIRSEGDSFSTLGIIETGSGRKLSCLPITDVAKIQDG